MRLQCFCPRDGELIDKIALCLLYEAGVNEHAVISIICFLLSVWILLPFSKFKHGIRYLFMLFAILQVLITIFMFYYPKGAYQRQSSFSISKIIGILHIKEVRGSNPSLYSFVPTGTKRCLQACYPCTSPH